MAKMIAAEKARTGLRYAVVCPNVTGRTKQGEDSPKQASSCWFARHSRLATTSGANLYPPGVLFADAMSYFSGVKFVSVCFVFVFLLSLKLRPLVQSFFAFRYACTLTTTARSRLTTVCVLFSFWFLWRYRFFRYFCTITVFIFVLLKVRRTFPPSGWCFSTL